MSIDPSGPEVDLDHVATCETKPCPTCAAYWAMRLRIEARTIAEGRVVTDRPAGLGPSPVLMWVTSVILVAHPLVVLAVVQGSVVAFCVVETLLLSALFIWGVRGRRSLRLVEP